MIVLVVDVVVYEWVKIWLRNFLLEMSDCDVVEWMVLVCGLLYYLGISLCVDVDLLFKDNIIYCFLWFFLLN